MFWTDNHRWDARTPFSDDPFSWRDVPPYNHDDLKIGYENLQAKIYGRVEALARISAAAAIESPNRNPGNQSERRHEYRRAGPARKPLDPSFRLGMREEPSARLIGNISY